MTNPVNRSNFFYYVFRPKSDNLSIEDQKKMKLVSGLLGGLTFGIGHAICGIVYLIQSSCTKASKTHKLATTQLNPQNVKPQIEDLKEKIKDQTIINLKKRINDCFNAFEKELPLNELASINMWTGFGYKLFINASEIQTVNKKEKFERLIEPFFKEIRNVLDTFPTICIPLNYTITFVMTSKVIEGFETIVTTSLRKEVTEEVPTGPFVEFSPAYSYKIRPEDKADLLSGLSHLLPKWRL